MQYKEIHIFDIDGCIFPLKNKNGEVITTSGLKEELLVENVIKRMKGVDLYSEFIKFYKTLVNNVKDVKTYFITGRRNKDFQNITIKQLRPLNTKRSRDSLIFFPDLKELTVQNYYKFKLYYILKIIIEDNGTSQINIYDDNCGYYDVLRKRLDTFKFNNLNCYNVYGPQIFWSIKNEEYKYLLKNKRKT